MSNLPQDFRLRMERLERNFEVSTVIFRKFEPIFMDMFQNPQGGEPPRQPRSRKHRHDTQLPYSTPYTICLLVLLCNILLSLSHVVLGIKANTSTITQPSLNVCPPSDSAGGCPVTSAICSNSAGLCLSTPKVRKN